MNKPNNIMQIVDYIRKIFVDLKFKISKSVINFKNFTLELKKSVIAFLKSRFFKQLLNYVSYILVILSFIYIYFTFRKMDIESLLYNIKYYWIFVILALSIFFALIVILYSIAWKFVILIFSNIKIKLKELIIVYLKANIAKYLPGNVFHFAGRHLFLRNKGISDKSLILSNSFEIIYLIFMSLMIILSGIIFKIINIPGYLLKKINIYYLLAVVILISILIITYFLNKLFKKEAIKIKHFFKWRNLYYFFIISTLYLLIFILTGSILYFIFTFLLKYNFNFFDFSYVLCTFALSWVLGYVVPGAPGGLGIRETVLIIMLTPKFSSNSALLSSIILRIITIVGDVIAFFFANLLSLNENDSRGKLK